jgi:hypothetical protein
MKIFTDKHGYPHSRHLCSTDPCSTLFIYTNAIVLEIPSLFYFKFSTNPDIFFYSKSQYKTQKFLKNLGKKIKKGVKKNENEKK